MGNITFIGFMLIIFTIMGMGVKWIIEQFTKRK